MTDYVYDGIIEGQVDFASAMADADEIPAAGGLDLELISGERLNELKGVPFLIVAGAFRERLDKKGQKQDFVTLAAIIPDELTLKKRHVSLEGKSIMPGMIIGFNDGSTGVRRQIVSYLHGNGYIKVVGDGVEVIESGSRDVCTYDKLVGEWNGHFQGELGEKVTKDGEILYTWEFKLEKGLMANRGLRTSSYGGRNNDENTTKYLA